MPLLALHAIKPVQLFLRSVVTDSAVLFLFQALTD